jgi:hypothetical protein
MTLSKHSKNDLGFEQDKLAQIKFFCERVGEEYLFVHRIIRETFILLGTYAPDLLMKQTPSSWGAQTS